MSGRGCALCFQDLTDEDDLHPQGQKFIHKHLERLQVHVPCYELWTAERASLNESQTLRKKAV